MIRGRLLAMWGRRHLVMAALAALGVGLAALPAARAQSEAPEDPGPRRYGDAGTSEISLLLGFSSDAFAVGGGFRYFVVDGVAPGVEGAYLNAEGPSQGFTFASVRVVPLRFDALAIVVTGRTGRVYLSEHDDGWAVGGDLGLLYFPSPHVGLEIGYEILQLLPDSFCEDLNSCVIRRPVLGLRIIF